MIFTVAKIDNIMKKKIPNPTSLTISAEEQSFVQGAQNDSLPESKVFRERKARPRNISVYDDFWEDIDLFLKEFPNEGNRSSLIARVVSDYIVKRRSELRNLNS